jgi:hypothetical protein
MQNIFSQTAGWHAGFLIASVAVMPFGRQLQSAAKAQTVTESSWIKDMRTAGMGSTAKSLNDLGTAKDVPKESTSASIAHSVATSLLKLVTFFASASKQLPTCRL